MTARRAPFVALVVALVVVGIVAGRAASKRDEHPAPAPDTTADTVWFCPGAPPQASTGDRVTIANTGTTAADVAITVLADKGPVVRQSLSVPASSVVTRARTSFGPAGALTVETFGGRVVVEEGFEARAAVDAGACASQSSTTWQFAAGSTAAGVQQWLVIDDPYATDAKVDVTMRTSSGVRRPEQLQGFDIARRSRALIPLHSIVPHQDRVAVQIDARVGRVVAAQTLVYSRSAPTAGIAMTVGSAETRDRWTFADGATFTSAQTWLAVANVGADDAQLTVQPIAANGAPTAPTILTLAQDDVEWLQVGNCRTGEGCVTVSDNVAFGLDVHSDRGVPIVAQTITHATTNNGQPGVATSFGTDAPAQTWLFARNRVDGERATTLAILNQLATPATVNVALAHGGTVDRPAALQAITVPGGRQLIVTVAGGRRPPATDAAIIVESSAPVSVERTVSGNGDFGRSPGVAVH